MSLPEFGSESPITWLRRRLAPLMNNSNSPAQQALILSGGGACASFQIGALRYLFEVEGINPQVITGTSAGSILGSVLAQYSAAEDQRTAVAEMEKIWRDLETSEDLFAPHPWFKQARKHAPTWLKAVEVHRQAAQRAGLLQTVAQVFNRPATRDEDDAAPSKSVGQPWSPTSAFEALAAYWDAGRTSGDIQLIMKGVAEERSAFAPGKVVNQLVDPAFFSPTRLGESPVELRIAVVSLESGDLRYVNGDGVLLNRDDEPVMVDGSVVKVDLIDAVKASCSIPGVFAPVLLADENYVDGGIRQNVPYEVAESIGVSDSYTVVATPPSVVSRESFDEADMFSIVMRSVVEIMSDELKHDEVAHATRAGSVVIQPEIAVHDTVTVDPGLAAIAIDYGYLRAQDVCLKHNESRLEITREIVRTRLKIWECENALWQPEVEEADTSTVELSDEERAQALVELAELKLALRDLVEQLPGEEQPPGAGQWWQQFEQHTYAIEATEHWL